MAQIRHFRGPPLRDNLAAIDDDSIVDGGPLSSWLLTELAANTNRLASMGHLMFNWTAANQLTDRQDIAARCQLREYYMHLLPMAPTFPVPKKPGLTKMRVAIKAQIPAGVTIGFFIGTSHCLDPNSPFSGGHFISAAGTGALATYYLDNIPCRESEGEVLSFGGAVDLSRTTDWTVPDGTMISNLLSADSSLATQGYIGDQNSSVWGSDFYDGYLHVFRATGDFISTEPYGYYSAGTGTNLDDLGARITFYRYANYSVTNGPAIVGSLGGYMERMVNPIFYEPIWSSIITGMSVKTAYDANLSYGFRCAQRFPDGLRFKYWEITAPPSAAAGRRTIYLHSIACYAQARDVV